MVGFPGGSDGKQSICNAGDLGSIPGLGRSPEEGHGNPLQYSCLENPHGQKSLWAIVHCVGPCCCSVAQSCLTFKAPWTAECQASLSFTISWSLFSFMSIELVMPFNNLICCPLFLLPSIFPMAAVTISSDFGVLENKSVNASTVSPSICHAVMGLGASLIAQLVKNPPAMQETPF